MIKEHTRYRQDESLSSLKLLLVNSRDIVQSHNWLLPTFGKSDHLKIEFSVSNGYSVKDGKNEGETANITSGEENVAMLWKLKYSCILNNVEHNEDRRELSFFCGHS